MRIKSFLTGLLFCFPLSNAAHAIQVTCPPSIDVTQSINSVPQDFTARHDSAPHSFDHMTFYTDNPSKQESLAPDTSKKYQSTWTFNANDPTYISCGYNNTEIELYKKLPDGITSCQVFYDKTRSGSYGWIPEKITCK